MGLKKASQRLTHTAKIAKFATLNSEPLVSAEELHMLLEALPTRKTSYVPGSGFKYRNLFLMVCTLWFSLRLIFFPEAVHQVLSFSSTKETVLPYLQERGLLYLLWLLIYCWSYAKDWYFERVALACFASELTIFGLDYLSVFTDTEEHMSPMLTLFLSLRFAFIACLLINALYAHQAPPAPRPLWR